MSADKTYTTKNYEAQGGAQMVIGGELRIVSGGKITTDDGSQAAAIAQVAGGATVDAEARAALNAVLTALHNVGILG